MDVVNGFLFGGGAAPGTVNLVDDSVTGTRYTQWTIGFDGFTYKRTSAGAAAIDVAWISPQVGMDQFEVRATVLSGDTPPGFIGTWLSLASSWTWGWTAEDSPKGCDLTIEIRGAVDHVVVDSATITLTNSGTL